MVSYLCIVLASLIASSRYAVTIGRPIVQSGTWHFTYAETLQFPYPLTVTLLQLIVIFVLLLCVDLLASFLECGILLLFSHHAVSRSNSSSTETSSRHNGTQSSIVALRCGWIFGSEWAMFLETIALAITIAADAALGTYSLSFAPLELYLLSRVFVVPVSLIASLYLGTKDDIRSKVIFPAAMLALGVLMTAYRPNIPHPVRAEWAAVFSSFAAAIWPLQWQRVFQFLSECSQTEYQPIGTDLGSNKYELELLNAREILRFLQYITMFAVTALLPILLYSGEVGRIIHNCYFLTVPDFWIFLFSGGAFRSILLVSSVLFIKRASALTYIILMVLIEVSQVVLLAYTKPLSSQWLGLTLCLLAGVGLCHMDSAFSTIPHVTRNGPWAAEGSQQSGSLFRRYRLQLMMLFLTFVVLIVGCVRMAREIGTQQIPKLVSPIIHNGKSPVPTLLRGNDAYLGPRPHQGAVANLNMLIEECRGTYEHLEHVRDINRCLEFLSTRQDIYLSVPEGTASPEPPNLYRNIEPDRVGLSARDMMISNNHSAKAVETCEGPIIPYHIWWTGLPNWRIELFIKSYFYTQNLACSKLWIWVNTDHHPEAMTAWLLNPRFQRFMPFVANGDILLKEWNLLSRVPLPPHLDELDKARYYTHPVQLNADGDLLVADSIERDSSGQEWVRIHPANDEVQLPYYTVAVSDAARLIILHLYGGVYMDPDMLLLRDLRPLLLQNRGFAERWGTSPLPSAYNNGLLYLTANSTLSSYLLLGGTRMGLMYHFQALGRMLVQEGRDDREIVDPDARGLLKLENAFFDPLWVENDGHRSGPCAIPCLRAFEQIFQAMPVEGEWQSFDGVPIKDTRMDIDDGKPLVNRTMENFYRGAYAMHVHNLWDMKYEPGSWVDVICQAHDGFFTGERTNPYGERWVGTGIEKYGD